MLLYLVYPAYLIQRQEGILERGEAFRFELQPVDPVDVFRGRYLDLYYELPEFEPPPDVREGQAIYLGIRTDERGYAYFDRLLTAPPAEGAYLRTRVSYLGPDLLYYELPDNMVRYYLNERTAPLAEAALAELLANPPETDTTVPAYALVRVLDGQARIEQLYFDGLPLLEYLKRES